MHRPLPSLWSGGGHFQVTLDVPGWARVGRGVTLGISLSLTCAAPSIIAFCCSDCGKNVCIFEFCGRKGNKVIFPSQVINLWLNLSLCLKKGGADVGFCSTLI